MIARAALVFLMSVAVAGLPPRAADDSWSSADAEIARCFAVMDADPALVAVNAKYARRNPTDAQLADKSFVTDAEGEALRQRILKTRPCREMRLTAVRAHHPLLEPAYTTLYYQADQVIEYLIQGSISYGVANHLAQEALAEFERRNRLLTAEQLNASPLPFAELMGVRFVSVTKDEIVAELAVRPDLSTAPMQVLHGGAAMALADTAGATATFLNLPEGAKGTTTIESKTNFLSPAPVGTTVRATTTPVHRGGKTQVWQTRITREDGKLVALVTQTQIVL